MSFINFSLCLLFISNSFISFSHKKENIKTLSLFCASHKFSEFTIKGYVDLYHIFSNSLIHKFKSSLKFLFNNAFTFSIINTFGRLFLSKWLIFFNILSISHKSQLLVFLFLENHFCFHC